MFIMLNPQIALANIKKDTYWQILISSQIYSSNMLWNFIITVPLTQYLLYHLDANLKLKVDFNICDYGCPLSKLGRTWIVWVSHNFLSLLCSHYNNFNFIHMTFNCTASTFFILQLQLGQAGLLVGICLWTFTIRMHKKISCTRPILFKNGIVYIQIKMINQNMLNTLLMLYIILLWFVSLSPYL